MIIILLYSTGIVKLQHLTINQDDKTSVFQKERIKANNENRANLGSAKKVEISDLKFTDGLKLFSWMLDLSLYDDQIIHYKITLVNYTEIISLRYNNLLVDKNHWSHRRCL